MPVKSIFLLTLFAFWSSSCDSDTGDTSSSSLLNSMQSDAAELNAHKATFLKEAQQRNINISNDRLDRLKLAFRDLPPNVLGSCLERTDGTIEVTISLSLRGNSKWTTLHELGHCLLRILHRDEYLSIMNSTDVSAKLDAADPQDLYDDLFQSEYFYAY